MRIGKLRYSSIDLGDALTVSNHLQKALGRQENKKPINVRLPTCQQVMKGKNKTALAVRPSNHG